MTYRPGVGVAGGPSGDPNYVPGVGKVNRDNKATRSLELGTFNATSGNPGSITTGSHLVGLGTTGGSPGAVSSGNRVGFGGLNHTSGSPGVIGEGGRIPGGLGGTTGSVGAVSSGGRVGEGGLGATSGNPGAIVGGGHLQGLGTIGGSSGAITRPAGSGLILGNLGATSGNPGSITSGSRVGAGGLGSIGGDPGAITHGGGRITGLYGEYGGSPGVVSHTGGTIPGGLGQTRPVGGGGSSINRGPGGSGGLRGGSRPFGSGRKNPKRDKKKEKPVPVDGCCGQPYTGVLLLDVEYRFDRWGNPVAPKVNTWKADIDGAPWTPPNWQDYTAMPDPSTTITNATDQTFIQNEPWGRCLSIEFDTPDMSGKLLSLTFWAGASGEEHAISATASGETLVAARAGLGGG